MNGQYGHYGHSGLSGHCGHRRLNICPPSPQCPLCPHCPLSPLFQGCKKGRKAFQFFKAVIFNDIHFLGMNCLAKMLKALGFEDNEIDIVQRCQDIQKFFAGMGISHIHKKIPILTLG